MEDEGGAEGDDEDFQGQPHAPVVTKSAIARAKDESVVGFLTT